MLYLYVELAKKPTCGCVIVTHLAALTQSKKNHQIKTKIKIISN